MASTPEPLSGGLVTARDASLLESGELTRSDDLMYIPNSPSLHRCFGRTRLISAAIAFPLGIAYCGFDQSADQLVELSGLDLYRIAADGSGVPVLLHALQGGTTLDAVHYNDRHILMTGSGRNRILLSSGTVRAHGLLPVNSAPGIVVTTGAGTWPLTDQFGTYLYWTTEVYKVGDEDVESTNLGSVNNAIVSDNTTIVTITRPAQVNDGATHWRIYRSALNGSFPVGFRIGEAAISTQSFGDGAVNFTAQLLPTTNSSITDNDTIRRLVGYAAEFPVCANSWDFTGGDVTADDGNNAVWTSTSCPAGSYPVATMQVSGFAFAGIGDPITKVQIECQARHTAVTGSMFFFISGDGGLTRFAPTATAVYTTAGVQTITVTIPGSYTAAGETHHLHAADFTASFRLYIHAINFAQIDYVKVQVFHGGTTANQTVPFDAIQVAVAGQRLPVGANGPPPTSTTGDVFQDSVVLNDTSHPSRVAYSLPGSLDYFPSPYILNLQTKDKDRLTCIRTIGSVCVFGLTSQVWRANYLPREEDAEFDRGRCTEVIDADNGILGPFGAAKFVLGGKLSLFYVSRSGPRMTDGFGCETANEDLDWPGMVSLAHLGKAIVINNAENQEILVYYVPTGGTTLSKCLRFQYHATHLKNGKLKAIGPCNVSVMAAAAGIAGDGERVLYTLKSDGFTYLENRGFADASPVFSTRDMYHGGAGGEWELHRVMLHTQGMEGELGAVYTITRSNNPERSTSLRTFEAPRRGFSLLTPDEGGEGLKVTISAEDVDEEQVFDYLVVEGNFVSSATPLSR